jgi:hypothetical protein
VIRANTLATTAVRKFEQRCEEKLSESIKDDQKSFYAYVRSKSNAKVTLGSLEGKDGQAVTEPKEVAKLFNDYFASVFTPENTTHLPDFPQRPEVNTVNKLSGVNFTIEAVVKALSKVRADKATGPDNITSRLLREIQTTIHHPLTKLFNKSMAEGSLPDD